MQEFALLALFMLLALGVWWSLVTFPKQRDYRKRQEFARSLVKGDEIITYGGIIGSVIDVNAETGIAQVEIADGVIVRMLNAALMQHYDAKEISRHVRRGVTNNDAQGQ